MRTMPVTLTAPGSKSVLLRKTASFHLPSPTPARPVQYVRANRFPFGAGGQLQHKTAPVCSAVRVTTQALCACCWLLSGCIIRIRPAQSSIPHKKRAPRCFPWVGSDSMGPAGSPEAINAPSESMPCPRSPHTKQRGAQKIADIFPFLGYYPPHDRH